MGDFLPKIYFILFIYYVFTILDVCRFGIVGGLNFHEYDFLD